MEENNAVNAQESAQSGENPVPSPDTAPAGNGRETGGKGRDGDGFAPGADPREDDDDDFIELDPADFPNPDGGGDDEGDDGLNDGDGGGTDDTPEETDRTDRAAAPDAARTPAGQTDRPADKPPDRSAVPLTDLEADAAQEAKYQSIIRNMVNDEGYTLSVARLAAAAECGGRHYATPPEFRTDAAPSGGQAGQTEQAGQGSDLMEEIRHVRALWPDITEMPQEVMDKYRAGHSMAAAYAAYRARADADAIRQLTEENARLRQQAEARSRAPVRGVTGAHAPQKGRDPAVEAFDREWDD